MKTNRYVWSNFAEFFLEWKMYQRKVVEKIETHTTSSIIFFRKSCRLWDNVKKKWYSRRGHRWQYGACALHAGYRRLHTFRIWNTVLMFLRGNNSYVTYIVCLVFKINTGLHTKHDNAMTLVRNTCIMTGPSQKRNQTCYNVRAYCGA